MKETPAEFEARTGSAPPPPSRSYDAAACTELGSAHRPLLPDEPCPTLYRDVGPQALGAFLEGALSRYAGPANEWLYLHDASHALHTRAADEFGFLAFLQPLALGPWRGRPGIWVAEADRLAPGVGFVPYGEELTALDVRLEAVSDAAGLRDVVPDYDDRTAAAQSRLRSYLEDHAFVERQAAPLRAMLDGGNVRRRDELRRILAREGVTEKDLRAPWFHLSSERRDEVRWALVTFAPFVHLSS